MTERFICPRCGKASSNPTDKEQGYCGACHDWTAGDALSQVQPVELIRDDPAWVYPSPTGPAARRLRMWDLGFPTPRCLVAVITEAGPGMSITDAAVEIRRQLAAEYPEDWLEVIEHWPAGSGCDPDEHYDQVDVLPYVGPQWCRLDSADLAGCLPGLTTPVNGGEPPLVYDCEYRGRIYGPYQSSSDADNDADEMAIRVSGKHVPAPSAYELRYVALVNACTRAGVELGVFDERILCWLSRWEPSTVQVVVGLISRANRAGVPADA